MLDIFLVDDIIIMQFSFYILLFLSVLTLGLYLTDSSSYKTRFMVFGNIANLLLYSAVLLAINGHINTPLFVGFFDFLAITFYILSLYSLFNIVYSKARLISLNVIHLSLIFVLSIIYEQVSILRMTTSLFIVLLIIDSILVARKQGKHLRVNSYHNAFANTVVFLGYKFSIFLYRIYSMNTEVGIDSIRTSIVVFTFIGLLLIIWINFTIMFVNYDILNSQYVYLSYNDFLTNIPNRRFAVQKIENAIINSKNNKTLYGLILLDIDGFKQYNDQYGHDFGDEVLVDFVERFKSLIRSNDLFARYGGDEFVVLINIKDKEELTLFINRIKSYYDKTLLTSKKKTISFSIGRSYIEETTNKDVKKLLELVDKNLYKDKHK